METIIAILLAVIFLELTFLVYMSIDKSSGLSKKGSVFVDTSVLIDGRILAVARSGFFFDKIVNIPRSVIGELQFLADNADSEKRSRARHGLDVITELQKISNVEVRIFPDDRNAKEGVDQRLLKLAQKNNGSICTIDYNLNKVAQTESIDVLNINDLAMNLRMSHLPGEKMSINLVQKGQESNQAVGYLADGTMVVVEDASSKIGQLVEIEFIRSLQTAAGKMMFAKLVGNSSTSSKKKPYKKPFAKTDKSNTKKPYSNKRNTHKPKRSNDREQNIIDLVNKQD